MAVWHATLRLGEVWATDEDPSDAHAVTLAHEIASRLRKIDHRTFRGSDREERDDIADEFELDVDGVESFDHTMQWLYDWADNVRVWVDTYKGWRVMDENTRISSSCDGEVPWSFERETELKLKLNTIIWENARADVSLGDAEKAAVAAFEAIVAICREKGGA